MHRKELSSRGRRRRNPGSSDWAGTARPASRSSGRRTHWRGARLDPGSALRAVRDDRKKKGTPRGPSGMTSRERPSGKTSREGVRRGRAILLSGVIPGRARTVPMLIMHRKGRSSRGRRRRNPGSSDLAGTAWLAGRASGRRTHWRGAVWIPARCCARRACRPARTEPVSAAAARWPRARACRCRRARVRPSPGPADARAASGCSARLRAG